MNNLVKHRREKTRMITRVEISGFKSLEGFEMDINPGLNILIGPNGSGKTNIILFFEFLAHLVRSDLSEAVSLMGGAGSLFRRVNTTKYDEKIKAFVYGCRAEEGRGVNKKYLVYLYEFEISLPRSIETLIFRRQSLKIRYTSKFISGHEYLDKSINWDLSITQELDDNLNQTIDLNIPSPKMFSDSYIYAASKSRSKQSMHEQTREFLKQMLTPSESLTRVTRFFGLGIPIASDILRGASYNIIPSKVRSPEDSAKSPGIEKDGSGLSATLYAIKNNRSFLHNEISHRFPFGRIAESSEIKLKDIVNYINLANSSIHNIDVINDSFNNQLKVSLQINDGEYNAWLPLTAMSDGTLKWLALITAVFTASSIFSIEEPENYLHPGMQAQVLDIMRTILLKKNKYAFTLMTTHSETILNNGTPDELIVVSFDSGRTYAKRCFNAKELANEIKKTGFGLGYYYIAGAIQNE